MIKNYIKIAFRNLQRSPGYSFINIFGLAIGMGCCILIALYVQNEWSYDEFHTKADRTYRAWVQERTSDGREILNTSTPVVLSPTLKANIPEIEHVTYIYQFNNLTKTAGKADPLSESVRVVHDDFFRIFDFGLMQGDQSSVFNNPSSVVLSEQAAMRLFGTEQAVGEVLSIRIGDEYLDFTVTGVLENAPSNSSLDYNILIPFENLNNLVAERSRNSWFNIFGSTYVTLQEGVKPADLDSKFEAMMQSTLGEDIYEETQYKVGLQPLTDIHLNPDFPAGLARVSDPVYSYILAAIALLILLIACVNFMTLSISKSAARAKEVGVRKTIGAVRTHLMYQFWGEALLMALFAFGLGITFAELLLPLFNELSATNLGIQLGLQTVGYLLLMAVVVSLIAGIYPALILSGFKPAEVLKGRMNMSADRGSFQKYMVVFQFALSITLIIGTITIRQQLNYVQNKNLGFQKDQVLVLESGVRNTMQNTPDEVIQNGYNRKQILESRLGSMPEIEAITASSYTPVQTGGWFRMGFQDEQDKNWNFNANIIDANFIPTLGINLVEGRNFSPENPSDMNRAIIVNKAAVEYFGWDNPIGQRLPGPEFNDHEVIGVVEDFHFESLHSPVQPLVLAMMPNVLFSGISNLSLSNSFNPRFSIKFTTGNLTATLAQVKSAWQEVAPGVPFNYTFVDQALDSQYRQERRLSQIVTTGALLAILIACLGLFGLASLMVVRRTKEIGVRKVLGASSSNIVLLINKEFTKLVAIAFVIAAPIAWYGMSNWLQDFAYRIELGAGIFALAGITVLTIAWATVSWQSIKATLINPVESLRSE